METNAQTFKGFGCDKLKLNNVKLLFHHAERSYTCEHGSIYEAPNRTIYITKENNGMLSSLTIETKGVIYYWNFTDVLEKTELPCNKAVKNLLLSLCN